MGAVNGPESSLIERRMQAGGVGETDDPLWTPYKAGPVEVREDSPETIATTRNEDGSHVRIVQGLLEFEKPRFVAPSEEALSSKLKSVGDPEIEVRKARGSLLEGLDVKRAARRYHGDDVTWFCRFWKLHAAAWQAKAWVKRDG